MKNRERLSVVVCYAAYLSIYFARLNLSSASPLLLDMGVLDAAQLGMLGSCFSVVYAVGRLINGNLSDRFPPWVMITCGLSAAAVGNLLFGLFPPYAGLLTLWILNALGQSMLWGAILSVVAVVCTVEQGKRRISIISTSASTGMLLSVVAIPWIISLGGARTAFLLPGGLTALCTIAAVLALRRLPCSHPAGLPVQRPRMLPLLRNKDIQGMAIPAVLHGCMKENITLWMTLYFVRQFSIDLEASSYYVLFIPLAGFLARLMCPFCLRLFRGSERCLSLVFFACSMLLSMGLCIATAPMTALICLGLLYIFITVINTVFVSVYPLNIRGNVSSVGGLMDFLTYIGSSISTPIYGLLINARGFRPMFSSWAILSAVCWIVLLILQCHNRKG